MFFSIVYPCVPRANRGQVFQHRVTVLTPSVTSLSLRKTSYASAASASSSSRLTSLLLVPTLLSPSCHGDREKGLSIYQYSSARTISLCLFMAPLGRLCRLCTLTQTYWQRDWERERGKEVKSLSPRRSLSTGPASPFTSLW